MLTLLILGGSVAAVLALVLIAWWLGLGGAEIVGEAEARLTAEETCYGFEAEQAFLSTDRRAALVRGADGSFVLLKVHGANLAARRLVPPLQIGPAADGVTVTTGERMFGDVRLRLAPGDRDKLLTMV